MSDSHGCSVLSVSSSGLPGEHLPEAAVERPPAGLQRVPRRLAGPGPLYAGLHLEARFVFRQRKGGQLPRGDHRQQAAAHLQKRQRAVQHTVSGGKRRDRQAGRSVNCEALRAPGGNPAVTVQRSFKKRFNRRGGRRKVMSLEVVLKQSVMQL